MTRLGARAVSRSVRALALAVLVLAVASLAAAVDPARACSCVPPDPWSILKQADGAFVGRLVSRREADQDRAVLTFRVERAVKGKIGGTVEITTANNGAACGIETTVGQRIGLFLAREGDRWTSTLCWQVSPEDLLAAAALPAPNGRGPIALFVGGRFGPARTIALDSKGRTLAYGIGSGDVHHHAVCPGGRRVVELVERASGDIAAIRELPTLWLVREQGLPRGEGVSSLRCVDALGEKLGLFSSGPDARGLLTLITPRRMTTLWRGSAFYASFWRDVAIVQVLVRAGTKLVAVDLGTGRRKTLGAVRPWGLYELVPNEAGTRLAGASQKEGIGDPRLVVIDLARRPISARTLPDAKGCCGLARWMQGDRLAYFTERQILVYTPTLRRVGRVSGWTAGEVAMIGSTAYGVRHTGALLRAVLPSGKVRVIRRLPGEPSVIVSAAR